MITSGTTSVTTTDNALQRVMRFPMNIYQGEGTSREKLFQLNVITSLIWDIFFQLAISLLA